MTTGIFNYLKAVELLALNRDKHIDDIEFMLNQLVVATVKQLIHKDIDNWIDIEKNSHAIQTRAYKLEDPEFKIVLQGNYDNFIYDRKAGYILVDTDFGGHEPTLEILYCIYEGIEYSTPSTKKGKLKSDYASLMIEEGLAIYVPSQSDKIYIGENVRLNFQERKVFSSFNYRMI